MDFQWLQQAVITLAEKSPLLEIDINCDWQTGLDISEMIDGNSFKKKKLNEYFINLQIHKYKDSSKVKITQLDIIIWRSSTYENDFFWQMFLMQFFHFSIKAIIVVSMSALMTT